MIRCGKCGTINEADASFCVECNAYLEWSGERIEDEGAAKPDETSRGEGGAAEGGAGAGSPADTGTRPVSPTERPATGRPGGTKPAGTAAPSTPPADAATAAPPTSTAGDAGRSSERAARMPAPPTAPPSRKPTAAAPSQPRSRQPERIVQAPVRKPRAAEPAKVDRPKPGDRVCQTCGTGNDPERKFCRRCGQSLMTAPVAPPEARPPWYRRLFQRDRRADSYAAGHRPASMGSRRRLRLGCGSIVVVLLAALGVGAVASYLSVPAISEAVDDVVASVRYRISEPAVARPIATRGTSAPGHPPEDAFGENLSTYWLGELGRRGRWRMEVDFQAATVLREIEIHAGATDDVYLQHGRPQRIILRPLGSTEIREVIELRDVPELQEFFIRVPLEAGQPLSIIVDQTYFGGEASDDVAIRNIAFGAAS